MGPLAQNREDGRKIRHHCGVAAFAKYYVADAAGETIAQRCVEARRTIWAQRNHQFDHDVLEHLRRTVTAGSSAENTAGPGGGPVFFATLR